MSGTSSRVPFGERGGPLRGIVDLVTGCYPAFLFGGRVSGLLPVFHFHEVTVEALEPQLQYLAENGYRTVTSDEIARLVLDGRHPGDRSVVLTFDDAWSSLWTVAAPLLRKYGMRAIAFAIPGRITPSDDLRPTIDHGLTDPPALDRSDTPFVHWAELKRLHASGVIDVQSHTLSHAMIFCGSQVVAFVTPDYARQPLLARPMIDADDGPRFVTPGDLGAPLYAQRSRMSDAARYLDDREARRRCMEYVAKAGGAAFFSRPSFEHELHAVAGRVNGRFESDAERERAMAEELGRSREILEAQIGAPTVRQVALPWGIAGEAARRALKASGYVVAFAERPLRLRAVRAGDDPFSLMRLNNKFLRCLPGKSRRSFFSAA
jgi:peptidoglycan/xylan/chitin deacetylase (PgdA/CDA1 family)